jgi:hypothetical protein
MYRFLTLSFLVTAGWLLAAAGAPGAGDKGGGQGVLVIVDSKGKEWKVKDWKFTEGTRRLSWVMPEGLEALEFYEGKIRPLKSSVLAYVPLSSIRSIEFDPEKGKEMTVRVARSDKPADDEVLVGPTGWSGFNFVTLTGTAEDDKGKQAMDFEGGSKSGVRSIRFPAPKPLGPPPPGRAAVVKHADEKYPRYMVVDLQPL